MFWLGAQCGRWALRKILGRWIADELLKEEEALEIAECICYRNALAVYRLDSIWQRGEVGASGLSVNSS